MVTSLLTTLYKPLVSQLITYTHFIQAKLPRGIDKIRPHLELVDNVPLLVSLFTDCTVSTTKEMIHIMQDYGEIVCVIGSSANADNVGIFLQANARYCMFLFGKQKFDNMTCLLTRLVFTKSPVQPIS